MNTGEDKEAKTRKHREEVGSASGGREEVKVDGGGGGTGVTTGVTLLMAAAHLGIVSRHPDTPRCLPKAFTRIPAAHTSQLVMMSPHRESSERKREE